MPPSCRSAGRNENWVSCFAAETPTGVVASVSLTGKTGAWGIAIGGALALLFAAGQSRKRLNSAARRVASRLHSLDAMHDAQQESDSLRRPPCVPMARWGARTQCARGDFCIGSDLMR